MTQFITGSPQARIETYRSHLIDCLDKAETGDSRANQQLLEMEGMTGRKTRLFYNKLGALPGLRYLEIGTWKGSSVCSVMCGNQADRLLCIDNWSQFGDVKQEFLDNFRKFRGSNLAEFLESDCFEVDPRTIGPFNVYLFDGDHSFDSHRLALEHFQPCMDDIFIFVVDDWNWEDVRAGTHAGIANSGLEIVFSREIRLTWDNSHTPLEEAHSGWWNGLFVAILRKSG